MTVHLSIRAWGAGWNPCTGSNPLIVSLELQPELVVEDTQVAIVAPDDRVRRNDLHLLRHHADIGLVAAVVAETIEPEAIVTMTQQRDVVLERDVGSPATATTTAHARAATAATRAHARMAAGRLRHGTAAATAAAGEGAAATAATAG